MDKDATYMKKNNMEILASFKGKSFANFDREELANRTTKVDIALVILPLNKKYIILNMVESKKQNCLKLLTIVLKPFLPDNLDPFEQYEFSCSSPIISITIPRSVGTADLNSDIPVFHTKNLPCLSHPFKIQ